jgi:hypothetical protein
MATRRQTRSPRLTRSATGPAGFALPQRADAGRDVCLELQDHSVVRVPASSLFGVPRERNAAGTLARLSAQFIHQNQPLMHTMDVRMRPEFDGAEVSLNVEAGSTVGAIPLVSPTSARHDYGLVVQPRFPWAGIGPMLGSMGWRVTPEPLRLPLLKRSERRVPPWVLSSMILSRLGALLREMTRRFEVVDGTLRSPKGAIQWNRYATDSLARARPMDVPCRYPELQEDQQLLGSIRHALELQLRSLETQRSHGAHVQQLLELARLLLVKVQDVAIVRPNGVQVAQWMQRPLRTATFLDGLQAIQWTTEGRGLAGISDLEGVPWVMPMNAFFEAWVETLFDRLAPRVGGRLRSGRKGETTHALVWNPGYSAAQRSLIPDLILERGNSTFVIDAKYKRHWDEWHWGNWRSLEEQLRAQHREDLLQALAYANLSRTARTVTCLCYPCSNDNWNQMRRDGRTVFRARVGTASRDLAVWVTAVPMHGDIEGIVDHLTELVRAEEEIDRVS